MAAACPPAPGCADTAGSLLLQATILGALWGWGHSVGQLILGLLFVLFKDRFDHLVPALSKYAGVMVGLTLIFIGCLGIYENLFEKHDEEGKEGDAKAKGQEEAAAAAAASASAAAASVEISPNGTATLKKDTKGFGLATFATGILYGLNPDTLLILVPALALPSKLAAAAYITMFVVGTVLAMSGYTFAIGATSEAVGKRSPNLTRNLSVGSAVVAIVFGVLVALSGLGFPLPFDV